MRSVKRTKSPPDSLSSPCSLWLPPSPSIGEAADADDALSPCVTLRSWELMLTQQQASHTIAAWNQLHDYSTCSRRLGRSSAAGLCRRRPRRPRTWAASAWILKGLLSPSSPFLVSRSGSMKRQIVCM